MTAPANSPELGKLLPCPLCASTNVAPGTCYVDLGRYSPFMSSQQPAVRCVDCGCRATLKAWNTRASAPKASVEPPDGAREAETVSAVTSPGVTRPIAHFRPSHAGSGVQSGYVTVPREPTQEMLAAAENAREAYSSYTFREVYGEMIRAALPEKAEGLETLPSREDLARIWLRGLWFEGDAAAFEACGDHPEWLSALAGADALLVHLSSSLSSADRGRK